MKLLWPLWILMGVAIAGGAGFLVYLNMGAH